jgi:hypothetical protein
MHEFIGTGTQGDTEAAHTGTQCDIQANSTGLLQKHEFIGTGTQGDLQIHSSGIQGDLQAGTSTDVDPSTHVITHSTSNRNSSVTSMRNRISFVNKCIRAMKSFFLVSSNDILYNEIGDDIFLN